ncbi:hypothetical protein IMSHALPRED_003089 [Imshaugia aleurites]|uniref:Uncharacterized protein n=1 Tax=Imshaugia aleurites TaxID=172621 RepID=A0A8H3J711_9LECA|nr:hypothetical protein IMSHALPRED_003089 [Imshaugia aleurites]
MSLESFPNELLIQIFKNMYPPGASETLAPYGLDDETLYPPHTYQTPGWQPTKGKAYTEFGRRHMYWTALFKADRAMQVIASISPRLRELSREILALRAEYIADWAKFIGEPPVMAWETLVQGTSHQVEFYADLMEHIDGESEVEG